MWTFNKTPFTFFNIQTPLFRNPLEFEIKICFVESLCFTVDSIFSVNAHNQFPSRGGGRREGEIFPAMKCQILFTDDLRRGQRGDRLDDCVRVQPDSEEQTAQPGSQPDCQTSLSPVAQHS